MNTYESLLLALKQALRQSKLKSLLAMQSTKTRPDDSTWANRAIYLFPIHRTFTGEKAAKLNDMI